MRVGIEIAAGVICLLVLSGIVGYVVFNLIHRRTK